MFFFLHFGTVVCVWVILGTYTNGFYSCFFFSFLNERKKKHAYMLCCRKLSRFQINLLRSIESLIYPWLIIIISIFVEEVMAWSLIVAILNSSHSLHSLIPCATTVLHMLIIRDPKTYCLNHSWPFALKWAIT